MFVSVFFFALAVEAAVFGQLKCSLWSDPPFQEMSTNDRRATGLTASGLTASGGRHAAQQPSPSQKHRGIIRSLGLLCPGLSLCSYLTSVLLPFFLSAAMKAGGPLGEFTWV